MPEYHLTGTSHGPMLIIKEGVQDNGAELDREIPVQAIASFSEMLGYADPAEALAAIVAEQDQRDEGNPVRDPFAEVQQLLAHREKAREEEAVTAQREGKRDDPRSPRLRAAFAAYHAVHEPVDDGDCVMDRCRNEARGRLNLAAPSRKAGAGLRSVSAKTRQQDELAQVVEQVAPQIQQLRAEFLHQLTGNRDDPLAETEPEPEPVDPVASLFKKYGGTA